MIDWQRMDTFPDGEDRQVLVWDAYGPSVVDCDNRLGDKWFNGDAYVSPVAWAPLEPPPWL